MFAVEKTSNSKLQNFKEEKRLFLYRQEAIKIFYNFFPNFDVAGPVSHKIT